MIEMREDRDLNHSDGNIIKKLEVLVLALKHITCSWVGYRR